MNKFWVFLLVLVFSVPALAVECWPRDDAVQALKEGWGEKLRAFGVTSSGKFVIELFVSEDNSTWTILETNTEKISCNVAEGANWQEERPRARKQKI